MADKIVTSKQLIAAMRKKFSQYPDSVPMAASFYLNKKFSEKLLNSVEMMEIKLMMGHEMSPLELLGMEFLVSGCHLDGRIEIPPEEKEGG